MNYILFDDASRTQLLPFTLMRPVADIRIGILSIRTKWELYLGTKTSSKTTKYLREKFPIITSENMILINGSVLPSQDLVNSVMNLATHESLYSENILLARRINIEDIEAPLNPDEEKFSKVLFDHPIIKIYFPWDIFSKNATAIKSDFEILTKGKTSKRLNPSNTKTGKNEIFIEGGAKVNGAILNTENGPIYIGNDAEVMEGCLIRGPFALCDNATLKMGAKIYGPTTIGPYSKVGGELNNVVIFGCTNKAHDGFVGNSVIGEWCNLGADTNSSNLKNTYEEVRVWSYAKERFIKTGLQFCGLIMGDHSKCGINTMFNTGTVVGVSANIFGPGFQRNFIKSFSWGGTHGITEYNIDKAIMVARAVFERRKMGFTDPDEKIFRHIHNISLSENI